MNSSNNTNNTDKKGDTDACRAPLDDAKNRYYDFRLLTFASWPRQMEPDKTALARCGFVYAGEGDKVICFFCGLKMEQWDRTDNPWKEHFKASPNCDYLNMIGMVNIGHSGFAWWNKPTAGNSTTDRH